MPTPLTPTVRRRRIVALTAAALVAFGVVGIFASGGDETSAPTDVRLEAWAPYWVAERATVDLQRRSDLLQEVSPFWFQATGATNVGIDPNAPTGVTDAFLAEARRAGLRIVPAVVDAMPARGMAAVLADPATRRQHVDTLVSFVTDGGFDGLDVDYEKFAFADGRDTWEATRPNWVAFVSELADALHDRGLTLTVSIPPVLDDERTDSSGYWVYDYGAIAPVVDRIRVMAYDYSTSSPGAIAPLEYVRLAIEGTIEASDAPDKLVLGIPLYGYNWPIDTRGTCPADQEVGKTSVTAASVADLVERRDAFPIYDEIVGEWSFVYTVEFTDGATTCSQTREVHYVDGDGARQRIELAKEAHLGGVSLWALGYDDEGVWTEIDPVVRTTIAVSSSPVSSTPS